MNENRPVYQVVKVTDSSGYDAQRGAHRTKQVHVRMQDGTQTYIELPHDQFTPEAVHQHLEHLATVHHQVMSLRPGQPPIGTTDTDNPWG